MYACVWLVGFNLICRWVRPTDGDGHPPFWNRVWNWYASKEANNLSDKFSATCHGHDGHVAATNFNKQVASTKLCVPTCWHFENKFSSEHGFQIRCYRQKWSSRSHWPHALVNYNRCATSQSTSSLCFSHTSMSTK